MSRLVFVACFTLFGCTPALQRTVIGEPIVDETTRTIWIVESDTKSATEDRLVVVVCHREASPACVRVTPQDMRDGSDYSRWLDTMPVEVRRLATLPSLAHEAPGSAPKSP
jgi:hypothetical protein